MHDALAIGARLLDAYGALFLARRRTVGLLVLAATLCDAATGACGLIAGLAALTGRAALRLPALPGEAEVLNAIYAGLALGAFYAIEPRLLMLAAFGGLLAVLLATALRGTLAGPAAQWSGAGRGLPLLGAPFLCTAWILLATAKAVGLPLRLIWPAWPDWLPAAAGAALANIGALFYVAHPVAGLLVLAALLLASRALALLACGGALLAHTLVVAGGASAASGLPLLAAFNGALVAIFLGGVLADPSQRALAVAAGGVAVASALSAALLALALPFGIPPLSAPFVLTVWLAHGALRPETSAWWARFWLPLPACPEDGLVARRAALARGIDADSIGLLPPFAGHMEVAQGVDGPHTHRGPWRYALDFVRTARGRSFAGDGDRLADFHCFGQPVLSPAWGVVAACRNDIADNAPGATNLVNNWGNHVLIALAGGNCVLLAHLRQGSVVVVPGQALAPGDVVGACGNSGRSTQPHLHLQVQRGRELGAATRPFHLSCYLEHGCFELNGMPQEGATLSAAHADAALAAGFAFGAGRQWVFAANSAPWPLALEVGLLGEVALVAQSGARVACICTAQLCALHRREGAADPVLDAFALAFGLTPFAAGTVAWHDAADARLLPLDLWQRLRVALRNPFGANLASRYTRQWDPVREIWVQHGAHRVAALGGAIVAQSTGWITETAGPVHFALTVAGHSIVDARLARVGNRGDHGVPAWSADYSLTASA